MSLRCFAFHGLITQAQIWKSFLVQNSTSLLYLNPFLHLLKLGKSLQTSCVNFFFAWTDILGEKNPYFGKHLLQNKDWFNTRARLCVQDFATGKNFSFNQCHNKEFCVFSRESYFIFTLEGLEELSTVMYTLDFVSGLHNCLKFSHHCSCLYQAMQTRKTFSIA